MTSGSITIEDKLFAELATVREQGYAKNSGEAVKGFWIIGRTVRSPRDEVYRSLNLSGPAYVIDREIRAMQVELLEHAVERFGQGVVELYQTQANEPGGE